MYCVPVLFLSLTIWTLSQISARPLNAPLLDVYDYIIVGGGVSGLTVANRLTEDPNTTVLVLEAGPADHYEEIIQVPVFNGADIYSVYDWYFETAPQTYLDGATRRIPQGRVLGGGSILNALLWNRGGQGDYNDWVTLGNKGWGWSDLLPYFMKASLKAYNSETYTPVFSEAIAEQYSINYNASVHGTSGPVNVSFPKYFYNTSVNFFQGLNQMGVPTVYDPNDGSTAGATYLPLDISPTNQTRADARRSYYDPYAFRDNLYVSTGQYVTNLIFQQTSNCANVNNNQPHTGDSSTGQGSGAGEPPTGDSSNGGTGASPLSGSPPKLKRQSSDDLRVIGVQYAVNAGSPRYNITARREVIMAAGALQTPKVLELSGIGSKSVLQSFGINVTLDLPGVGNNYQDHYLVGTYSQFYNASYIYSNQLSNATLNDEARAEYYANRTGPWTAGPADGNAFPSLSQITNSSAGIVDDATAQNATSHLAPGIDETVLAGYTAQKALLVDALSDPNRAVVEILNSNAGGISPSVMRPFSRGTTHINSTDPFTPPNIDPRYGSNPVDLDVLYESLLFHHLLLQTPAMQELDPYEWVPTANANESALRAYINSAIGTEYHPSGTCSMLPLDMGGVVDSNLLVYGTQNLRIVDASIYPIIPASHLQAVVYGVAEKAADIIKAANAYTDPSVPSLEPLTCNSDIRLDQNGTIASNNSTIAAPSFNSTSLVSATNLASSVTGSVALSSSDQSTTFSTSSLTAIESMSVVSALSPISDAASATTALTSDDTGLSTSALSAQSTPNVQSPSNAAHLLAATNDSLPITMTSCTVEAIPSTLSSSSSTSVYDLGVPIKLASNLGVGPPAPAPTYPPLEAPALPPAPGPFVGYPTINPSTVSQFATPTSTAALHEASTMEKAKYSGKDANKLKEWLDDLVAWLGGNGHLDR
ncbi:MAG: hypothetical protein M1828_003408 [Chrysothrix sp. TS-e1954]|nr:MAG: hypothetical protein M1828_003408 [Chrysothrix sp. TS-e1954]